MRRKKMIAVVILLFILPIIDEALAKWELSKYPQENSIPPIYIWYKPRVSKFLSLKIAEHYAEIEHVCCGKYAVIRVKQNLPLKLEHNETEKLYEELRILYSEHHKILQEVSTTNDTERLYDLVWRYYENQEDIKRLKKLINMAVLDLSFSWISFYSFIFYQFGFLIGIVLLAIFLEQFERRVKINKKIKTVLIILISTLVVIPLVMYGLPLNQYYPKYLDMNITEDEFVAGAVNCHEEWDITLNDEASPYLKSILQNLTVSAVYYPGHVYGVTVLLNQSQRDELFKKLSELTNVEVVYCSCSVNKTIETTLKVKKTVWRLYVDGYLSKEKYKELSAYCDELGKRVRNQKFTWDYEVHMSFG